eukprot:1160098-Pelagomonas_calceolata.AAC.12
MVTQVQALMQEKSTLAAHMRMMSDEQEKLQERLAFLLLPPEAANGEDGNSAGLMYSDDGDEDYEKYAEEFGDDLFYNDHTHSGGHGDPCTAGRAQLLQGHKSRSSKSA